jgi:hypothetical protein
MRYILPALVALSVAVPCSAQQLKMSFNQGLVSIEATQVPVRTILSEWSKLGGTKVVNGERVTGAPLTLTLVDTPEPVALDIILRSVAGYMAAPRASANGASLYDRILVMPTSTAPAAASTAARPNTPAPAGAANRFAPPRPMPSPTGDDDAAPPPLPEPDVNTGQPVFSFPQPQQGNIFQPIGQPTPFGTPIAPGTMPPQVNPNQGFPGAISINPAPGQPGTVTFPGQPNFGVFGAPTPGVVSQPPQPQPGVTVIRPPGQ